MKTLLGALLAALLAFPAWATVDLNTATQSELEAVKGLGPAKAKAIIEYRDANGKFKTVDDLDKLRNGVVLDDGHKTKKAEVFVLREEDRNTWVQITLHEGKNRQIHRMGEAIGHPVLRLARVSFAGITAEGLRPGESRELDARELEKLKKTYLTPQRRAKDREAGIAPESPKRPAAGTAGRARTKRA